jgi:hypothetical protein
MLEGRCRNCKWWEYYGPGLVAERDGWGQCQRVWEDAAKFAPLGYSDGLITSPDFGCVDFEAKDVNPPQ